MRREEGVQGGGTDLLFTLDQDPHVAGQRSRAVQPCTDRVGVGHRAGLVVGGAATIETSVALLGFERVARPVLDDARRLHVVVRIQQHGRGVGTRVHPFADHERLRSLDPGRAHVLESVRPQ
jgi:hypothetical protein